MANAIKHSRLDIVKVLLEAYKEAKLDINTKDKNGYTILHLAVQSSEKVLMTILQCEGIGNILTFILRVFLLYSRSACVLALFALLFALISFSLLFSLRFSL